MTRRVTPLAAACLLIFSACAAPQQASSEPEAALSPPDVGPALSVQQPPRGSLSNAQLAAIAADIRRVEARPLAAGAAESRANLFRWVVDSPDVSVTLCEGLVGPLTDSSNPYKTNLLNQFILSSSAHQIEHPGADAVATNVAGLEGALASYTVIMSQQGRRARDSFMERVRERSQGGTLASFVRSNLGGC